MNKGKVKKSSMGFESASFLRGMPPERNLFTRGTVEDYSANRIVAGCAGFRDWMCICVYAEY